MLLAIDVGNTQTVVGVYKGSDLAGSWRVATNKSHTSDELRIKLMPLFESAGLSFEGVRASALASVVPQLTHAWVSALRCLTGSNALVCTARFAIEKGLFQTAYPQPSEIGADRVADAVAALARYGAPAVVVDFGTATNIEVIDREGRFVGGIIAPGVETSASALFSHATRLAAIELADPGCAIGTSTETAMRSGIVYGEADRVDGLVRRIFAQLGYETPVIATGGLANLMARYTETITHVDGDLTLEGLRLIAEASLG